MNHGDQYYATRRIGGELGSVIVAQARELKDNYQEAGKLKVVHRILTFRHHTHIFLI